MAADQLAAGRLLARQTRRHSTAALAAVDAIEAAATMPFEAGSRRERELCTECIASGQCKALIHVFFAERAVTAFLEAGEVLVERMTKKGLRTFDCRAAVVSMSSTCQRRSSRVQWTQRSQW